MKLLILISSWFLLSGCSLLKFNAVEGKVSYDEHYVTVNNVDYRSGEMEGYGFGITNKRRNPYKSWFAADFSIYPDLSYEQSKVVPVHDADKIDHAPLRVRRISGFVFGRGIFYMPIGSLDVSVGAGPSYLEAYNDQVDTSKIEPTLRYQGTYTAYLWRLYGAVSFVFQESPWSTYSEYYSLVYKAGFIFNL